jgi:hypothetical protein
MEETKTACNILFITLSCEEPLGRTKRGWKNNIKIDLG